MNVKVLLASTCHSDQHPTDAELNWNDGRAIPDFEDEEELEKILVSVGELEGGFALTFFPSASYFSLPGSANLELRMPIPLNAPPIHPATSTANGIF